MADLVFFDLDGCITDCNLSELLLKGLVLLGQLPAHAPALAGLLEVANAYDAIPRIEEVFQVGYGMCAGLEAQAVRDLAQLFVATKLQPRLRQPVIDLLKAHQARGDTTVLLSCSTAMVVGPIAEMLGFTEFHALVPGERDGVLDGRISGVVNGRAKVAKLVELSAKYGQRLDRVAFYTDSHDDELALRMVGRPRAVYPDAKLRELARERRWPVLDSPESLARAALPKVVLLTASTGGGHNATAEAIAAEIVEEAGGPRFDPVIVKIDDVSLVGRTLTGLYNHLAQHRPGLYRLLHETVDLGQGRATELVDAAMEAFCREQIFDRYEPAAVVCVHAMAADTVAPHLKRMDPALPVLTCVTDWLGGCLKGWGNDASDVIFSPSPRNAEHLTKYGAKPAKLVAGSPVFHRKFERAPRVSRESYRESLGLHRALPTVLCNTNGSAEALSLLEQLETRHLPVQFIALCGRDEGVYARARALAERGRVRVAPVLYTSAMELAIYAADVAFTKPGPGVCSEALAMKRGLLLNLTQPVMPQEQELVGFTVSKGLAVPVENAERWLFVLEQLAADAGPFPAMRAQCEGFSLTNGLGAFTRLVLDAAVQPS